MSDSEQISVGPSGTRSNTPMFILVGVTVCIGVGAGLGGMALALLLHFLQHLAYGYSMGAVMGSQSFLQGVTASAPARRVLVLLICGCVAGLGWWAVYRLGRPLVSISKAIKADDPRMPVATTVAHALLQIITVALGSPLGREVAPREIGATFAGWLSHRIGLTAKESRIMVACGAGAGLAAVYNVPLGGAIFVLEVLLGTFTSAVAIPALLTSVIAAAVAWIGLGNDSQYTVPHFQISYSLVIWSIVIGPVFGFLAYWFSHLTAAARAKAPRDWRLLPCCMVAFVIIGLVAIPYPQLLGNGNGPIQLGFNDAVSIPLAVTLLLLKLLAITGSLRAGAEGGQLTPGMTIGAMLAIITGGLWNAVCPVVPLGTFAIVGAAAFLAASMRMPITAIVLAVEFTHVDHDYLVPVLFAVAGSTTALRMCIRHFDASASRAAYQH
ncbi:chloride channel protein [Rhodanobacter sp. MP1X3]|uniref:chloride channel protein n=1 Tax=Rhodanobacter sp. MP1X3 TaxID=2723086 RepID=UPI0017C1B9A3|nr:H+/Cl- antiporter ClcA [Rhodanobacter sp. MP1X3]